MTLTKEWLQQTIAELEEERDATPGSVNEDAAMALAAMKLALASLTAEPVGFIHPFTPFTFGKSSGAIFKEETRHYYKPVYAAPPAPVAVPECFVRFHEIIKKRHHGRMPEEVQMAFDECAAMLQGKAELPAYEIKTFGQFSVIPHSEGIDGLAISIQKFHFERGTIPEKAHEQSIVVKYALQAIINALQQKCDGMDDTPIPQIWPSPQQEVKP